MAAFPSAHNDYALKLPQAQKSSIAPTLPATSASCLRNQPLKTPHVCSSQIDHKQKSGFASTQKSGFENNTTHGSIKLDFTTKLPNLFPDCAKTGFSPKSEHRSPRRKNSTHVLRT
jgi:hypothetical protein